MFLTIVYHCTQKQKQITFSIEIDDQIMLKKSLDGSCDQFTYQFDDSDAFRAVKLRMSLQGKTHQHTMLDEQGNILSDCAVMIDSMVLDGIDVTEMFCQGFPCYTHDSNGTTSRFLDDFYGFLGCNADVNIEFTLPLYGWFLKHCQ